MLPVVLLAGCWGRGVIRCGGQLVQHGEQRIDTFAQYGAELFGESVPVLGCRGLFRGQRTEGLADLGEAEANFLCGLRASQRSRSPRWPRWHPGRTDQRHASGGKQQAPLTAQVSRPRGCSKHWTRPPTRPICSVSATDRHLRAGRRRRRSGVVAPALRTRASWPRLTTVATDYGRSSRCSQAAGYVIWARIAVTQRLRITLVGYWRPSR